MVVEEKSQQLTEVTPFFKRGPVLSEINLIEHPFCVLTKETRRQNKTIHYEELSPDGVKHVWEVMPNVKYGQCCTFEKKVVITVQKLATDAAPQGGALPRYLNIGSLNEFCRVMQIEPHSENRKAIKTALLRIAGTVVYTDNFYLKERNEFWESSLGGGQFTLWNVYWKGQKLPNGQTAQCIYLEFNAPFILSLLSHYVIALDFDYYLQLPPIGQRLYELTRQRFFGLKDSKYARYEYLKLCQMLPIQPQRYFSYAKRAFLQAHHELAQTGWFADIEWQGPPLSQGQWAIHYYPGPRAERELTRARENQAAYQTIQQAKQATLPGDKWAQVDGWVVILGEKLGDPTNRPYYRLLGYLIETRHIPESMVHRLASEARVLFNEGQVRKSPSAWFTDQLKRTLQGQGKDLKVLLETAKRELAKPKATPDKLTPTAQN